MRGGVKFEVAPATRRAWGVEVLRYAVDAVEWYGSGRKTKEQLERTVGVA